MNLSIFLYSLLGSIFLILFSRSDKYYDKTVEAHGEKFADKIFQIMKVGGYLMLVGALFMLILIVTT
jgi:hypothetical protein